MLHAVQLFPQLWNDVSVLHAFSCLCSCVMTYLYSMPCSCLRSCLRSCVMTYLFLPLHAMQLCDNVLSAVEGEERAEFIQFRPSHILQLSLDHARILTFVIQATLHFLCALQKIKCFKTYFVCSRQCSYSRNCGMTFLCSLPSAV